MSTTIDPLWSASIVTAVIVQANVQQRSPLTPVVIADPPPSITMPSAPVLSAVFAVVATPPDVVTSPVKSALEMLAAPVNLVRFPFAGLPVVVTVPPPDAAGE